MIKSIQSYLKNHKVTRALEESQRQQYVLLVDAMNACNRLVRTTQKDYWIVKHEQESLFWVVGTKSAKILAQEGHRILKAGTN
ncbi:hypothetical protein GCM10027347_04090 [Larkinella harenae]